MKSAAERVDSERAALTLIGVLSNKNTATETGSVDAC